MAGLAIRGHESRGKEVIEILEMLGGKNIHNYGGTFNECYAIDNNNICTIYTRVAEIDNLIIFTLEEFEKKFPYKVGDKVCYQPNPQIDTICISEIISMKWADNNVIYFTNNGHSLYACDLQPYKEEIIEEGTNKAVFEGNAQSCDIMNDIIKEETMKEKGDKAKAPNLVGEDYSGKRFGYKIPQGYEIDCIQNNEIIIKPIKPQYPKTYEECCNILGYDDRETYCIFHTGVDERLFENLHHLKVCCDAYWKIVGEEMGLGKHWKPDWNDESEIYYTISYDGVNIKCYNDTDVYSKIAFPTAEMRDVFYENFKVLIEQCKELL